MRFLGQRQMTINHSTVTSTSMILTSGPLAPQTPWGMQVGLDVCLHMPSVVLYERNPELKGFTIFTVSSKQDASSTLKTALCKHKDES